ncbi:MAG: coproporphyrinogen-III oxidase family protein, partial [Acidimicrobiia bacterium]
ACRSEVASAGLPAATSVFFGGGTPSLLPPAELVGILAEIERTPDAEVTVECNPETVTPALLEIYLEGGVNRLSFGVQSMVPEVLATLGREHDPAAVERAVAAAKGAGFESWSVDLIYGGAGESTTAWELTLQRVLALDPPHVSAYALTVEAGTPLAAAPDRHPDDDDLADKYLLAEAMFSRAGLANYEISNWARPGRECRHNQLYWQQGNYHGIGCAAHSHHDGRRWWNVRTPERYISLVEAGMPVVSAEDVLDEASRAREALQLALRTREGVPAEAVAASERLRLGGLLEEAGEGRLRLSVRGRLLANEVALALL